MSGLYFFLEYVLPEKIGTFQFGLYHSHISRGFIVVGTMAIGLGVINIVRVHGVALIRTRKGWINSFVLLLGLLVMFTVEGSAFLSSEARVTEWKSLSDLRAYSERVRSDYIKERIPAHARIELLVQHVDKIQASKNDSSSFLRESQDTEEAAKISADYYAALEVLRTRALSLSELYYEREGEGLQAEDDESSFSLQESLKEYTALQAAHTALEQQVRVAAEFADDLSRFHYDNSGIAKSKSLLSNSFLFPLGAAMFSLLAFYIATAAYRSFRIRSAEAFIMMLAAVIVTLGQIPHGPLYVSEDLPLLRLWLLKNLSTPAFRAIYFGAALAGLAMAVRMWLSLEQSPLATEDNE